jgi:hypothetical protein
MDLPVIQHRRKSVSRCDLRVEEPAQRLAAQIHPLLDARPTHVIPAQADIQ